MITSIEIAQILRGKNANKKVKSGFDTALFDLGISNTTKDNKKSSK